MVKSRQGVVFLHLFVCVGRNHFFLTDRTQSRKVAVRRRSGALAAGGLLAKYFCRDPAAAGRQYPSARGGVTVGSPLADDS